MKRYLKIMIQTLPWYLTSLLTGQKRNEVKLPDSVKSYSLVKNISPHNFPFATGLYRDERNRLVVIKIWSGRQKSIYYFNLIHQIEMTQILDRVQKRIFPNKKTGFFLPEFIDSKISDHQVFLIMEYVSGSSLEKNPDADFRFEVYEKCLAFLEELSQHCTEAERKKITIKSVLDFIFLYPFITLTAIMVNPHHWRLILSGIPVFLRSLLAIKSLTPDRLIHGDLHLDNILVGSHGRFFLLDTENMRFSYPAYEPISSISLKGNTSEFKQRVTKKYLTYRSDKNWNQALAGLMINNTTHNLAGDTNPEGVQSYLAVFKKGLALAKLA